jgi:hypothetical protein
MLIATVILAAAAVTMSTHARRRRPDALAFGT